jgi:hypothetical protein
MWARSCRTTRRRTRARSRESSSRRQPTATANTGRHNRPPQAPPPYHPDPPATLKHDADSSHHAMSVFVTQSMHAMNGCTLTTLRQNCYWRVARFCGPRVHSFARSLSLSLTQLNSRGRTLHARTNAHYNNAHMRARTQVRARAAGREPAAVGPCAPSAGQQSGEVGARVARARRRGRRRRRSRSRRRSRRSAATVTVLLEH